MTVNQKEQTSRYNAKKPYTLCRQSVIKTLYPKIVQIELTIE